MGNHLPVPACGERRAEAATLLRRAVHPTFHVVVGGSRTCCSSAAGQRGATADTALTETSSDGALAGHVALVVDDEPMILEIMAEHCTSLGMEILQASNGDGALGLVETHPEIEVLVTDVRMPGLDGPELVERALVLRPTIKVIFVTGYTTYRSSAWPILRKPFDLDDLEAALRGALTRQSSTPK
jgi:CheY-like chemotaxis protein